MSTSNETIIFNVSTNATTTTSTGTHYVGPGTNTWSMSNQSQGGQRMIGLDFETYSAESLPVHGLMRYVYHDTFRVLIASVYDGVKNVTFDFINDPDAVHKLNLALEAHTIVAHNAMFEKQVLARIGIHREPNGFIDSAIIARAAGAGGSLSAAAPQLLDLVKLDEDRSLIKLFCVPSQDQMDNNQFLFDTTLPATHPDKWQDFITYCELDAELSYQIYDRWRARLVPKENTYAELTMEMNEAGWHVDLDAVREMQRRYLKNQEEALAKFQDAHNAHDLNLNSLKQLKEWCADRGIKASSFDEKHVAKLKARLEDKLWSTAKLTPEQRAGYEDVHDLLETKQILGGSSLKKLQVILDTQFEGRLYDQYLHCGAGQTLRTTGRSVQMQNLKRLSTVADMGELFNPDAEWDNTQLAANLRQVFTATDPQGELIVGDFSSVESRGLAWLAGEDWKKDSYRRGMDLYKVLASKIYGVVYENVTKEQRQTGKVGELSCGYGAGPDAVVSFAEGMGVKLEKGEATKLVWDWRDANPKIVEFWQELDDMLKHVVEKRGTYQMPLSDRHTLVMHSLGMPASLKPLIPQGVTVEMAVGGPGGNTILRRYFHGCHTRGRNICYFKPSDRKTGDLWKNTFIDPKTKQRRNYDLYGGKLAGILTQSLCRELFFSTLQRVSQWVDTHSNMVLVGQFHDEIVVDWAPGGHLLDSAKQDLTHLMSVADNMPSFPMAAEVKSAFRYTK